MPGLRAGRGACRVASWCVCPAMTRRHGMRGQESGTLRCEGSASGEVDDLKGWMMDLDVLAKVGRPLCSRPTIGRRRRMRTIPRTRGT